MRCHIQKYVFFVIKAQSKLLTLFNGWLQKKFYKKKWISLTRTEHCPKLHGLASNWRRFKKVFKQQLVGKICQPMAIVCSFRAIVPGQKLQRTDNSDACTFSTLSSPVRNVQFQQCRPHWRMFTRLVYFTQFFPLVLFIRSFPFSSHF